MTDPLPSDDGPDPASPVLEGRGLPERLGEAGTVWLATVRPDGSPHLTPIWYVVARGRLWLCSGADAVKARNLRANPRASFSLADTDQPLVGEATVTVHARPYLDEIVEAFRRSWDWDVTIPSEESDFGALLELRVDRWLMGG